MVHSDHHELHVQYVWYKNATSPLYSHVVSEYCSLRTNMHSNGTFIVRMALIAVPPYIYECAFDSNLTRNEDCCYPGLHVEILAAIFEAAKVSFFLDYVVSAGRVLS